MEKFTAILLPLVSCLFFGLRLPLMELSLHPDEQHTLAFHAHGYYPILGLRIRPPVQRHASASSQDVHSILRAWRALSDRAWHPQPLSRTLWANEAGNNPPLAGLLARLSLKVLPTRMNLTAARLPSLLAQAVALVALYLLCKRLWGVSAALSAAILFSMHPLLITQSAMVRGYSLMVLSQILALALYHRALSKEGKLWHWAAASFCMAAAALSFAGFLHVLLCSQLYLLWHLRNWHQKKKAWILGSCFGGLLALPVAGPWFWHLWQFMGSDYPYPSMNFLWPLRMLSAATVGRELPHSTEVPVSTFMPSGTLLRQMLENPVAWVIGLLVVPFLFVFGLGKTQAPLSGLLLCGPVGVMLSVLVHGVLGGSELHSWYAIPAVVPVIMGIAVFANLTKRHWLPPGIAFGLGLLLVLGQSNIAQQRKLLSPPGVPAAYWHNGQCVVTLPDGSSLLARPGAVKQIQR